MIRTLIALLTDSTFLYFLQPIISDGVIAAMFLLSLATARPPCPSRLVVG